MFSTLPSASVSKVVSEINGKEHELSFHPHFIHEGFTSLHCVLGDTISGVFLCCLKNILIQTNIAWDFFGGYLACLP